MFSRWGLEVPLEEERLSLALKKVPATEGKEGEMSIMIGKLNFHHLFFEKGFPKKEDPTLAFQENHRA